MTKDERYRAIAAYCTTHTAGQAAQHFEVSERTVYNALAWVKDNTQAAPLVQADDDDRRFPDLMPGDTIARDGTSWRCPHWAELVPVVPGTRRDDWLAERKRLHESVQNVTPDPAAHAAAPAANTAAPANLQTEAGRSFAPANVQFCSTAGTPVFAANAAPGRAQIRTVIVREYAPRRGLIPGAWERVTQNYHVALGVALGLILVALCW